jgi:hypothetical protein
VTYTDPGGNRFNMSGAGCSFPFAVGPGGTWSVSTVYLYCQDVDVTAPIDRLTATIIYSDTSGTTKTVSATSR